MTYLISFYFVKTYSSMILLYINNFSKITDDQYDVSHNCYSGYLNHLYWVGIIYWLNFKSQNEIDNVEQLLAQLKGTT